MKVIISDTTLTGHPVNVRTALMLANTDLQLSDIEIRTGGLSADLAYAQSNGAILLIRSTTGAQSNLALATSYYNSGNGILVCMPAGANSIGEVFTADIPQDMCITGAGDEQNETADNVEFISNDPITPEAIPDEQDLSSYSNGYIAGQLLKIKEARNCNWEEARIIARATSSNTIWSETDGYGFIDVNSAISLTDPILTVGTLTAVRGIGFASTITLERIVDATNYKIEVRKLRSNYQEIIETTDLVNAYTLTSYGHFKFRYMGYNGSLESEWSSWQEIKYNSFDKLGQR